MLRKVLLLVALGSAVLAGPAVVPQSGRRGIKSELETTPEITTSAVVETSVSNEVGDGESEAFGGTEIQSKPESTTNAEETSTAAAVQSSSTVASGAVSTTKPRKTITFDQRQQGKFNIRADLENFMIVVVPSSPSAGISLLDLLNRSSQKKHQKKKSAHRKNSKNSAHKKMQHITPEVVVLDESNSQARLDHEEFIEGRTPYKVDISSSARSDSSENPSPIYRVVRPFTFNVEQPSTSNAIRFPSASGNYYGSSFRASKSLLLPAMFEDEIRTNTVYNTLLTDSHNNNGDGDESSIDLSEADGGSEEDLIYLMPERLFLDLPASHDSSFDSLAYPHSDVDMTKLQLQPDDEQRGDGWDLKLLGAQEQCGPGAKRDSYGVCQFVTP